MAQFLPLEAELGDVERSLTIIPAASHAIDDGVHSNTNAPSASLSTQDNRPSSSLPPFSDTMTLAGLHRDTLTWTLHSDHNLHTYLKQCSMDLFTRTKDMENTVRDIAAAADSAHVGLKNTFNQFLMLSNNQFMENRVYDEEQEDFFGVESSGDRMKKQDVEETPVERKKTDVMDEQDDDKGPSTLDKGTKIAAESIVTKYRAALEMGMEAMKLFVMMEEDEEDNERRSESGAPFDTVLDIYNERPLPFIIGTREFLEDETLGLGAAPEEERESDSSSSYTSSHSSLESDSDSSSSNTSQISKNKRQASHSRSRYRSSSEEMDESRLTEQLPRRRADSDESDTSGLFGRPLEAESSRQRVDSTNTDTSEVFGHPSELVLSQRRASSSRNKSLRQPVFDDDENDSRYSDSTSDSGNDGGKKMSTSRQRITSRRSREVPPPFAAPTPARKSQYLDSSDEESDAGLFGSVSTTKPRVFATDETETPNQRKTSRERSSSSGSSSSGEEGQKLGATSKKNAVTEAAPQQGFRLPPMGEKTLRQVNELESKKSFLSSDSDVESTTSGLFGQPSDVAKDMGKKAAGISVLPAPQQSQHLDFSDDSSSDDGGLFGATPAKPVTPVAQPVTRNATIPPPRHVTHSDSSSDDDEDGEDLFGVTSKSTRGTTVAPPIARSQLTRRTPSNGLFGEGDSEDSDGGAQFGAKKAVTKASPSVAASRPAPHTTAPTTAVQTQPRQSRVLSDSSDSDEGGLFGAPSPRPASTLAPIPAPKAAVTSSVPLSSPFTHQHDSSDDDSDDWSDDDGGLFGVATSKPVSGKPAVAPVSAVQSARDSASSQAAASTSSTSGLSTGKVSLTVHPPIPSAAARLRAAESASDSDSDSDWNDDAGLFGPAK